jgi:hypothetical protein
MLKLPRLINHHAIHQIRETSVKVRSVCRRHIRVVVEGTGVKCLNMSRRGMKPREIVNVYMLLGDCQTNVEVTMPNRVVMRGNTFTLTERMSKCCHAVCRREPSTMYHQGRKRKDVVFAIVYDLSTMLLAI